MKFSNGCWLQKEGVQLFAPAEAYFITKTDTEVTICAPTSRVYNKGCTLGGINLTVKISSPRKDVLRVQTYHHLGAVVKEPAFELNMEECPLTVTEDEEKIVVERDEFRAAEKLHFTSGDDIYQLYGTDSMALSYKVYDHMKKLALERSKEVQA